MSSAQSILKHLTALEPVKTWSLIVTLLGDMDEPQLSGKDMGCLLGYVGLKPEAIRVAIHRLKKDGWISTSKNGREVIYHLSTAGVSATHAVYSDVYDIEVKYRAGWKLVLVESSDALEDMGEQAIRLLKRIYLLPASSTTEPYSALEIDLHNHIIPDWLAERVVPENVLNTAAKLDSLAQKFIDVLHNSKSKNISTIDIAALRLMMLHRWRKMALHDNTWAHVALFPDGPMAQCHCHVTQLLTDLPRLEAKQFSTHQ